tara:strand:+ start:145 stop:696 length:552 start_codon:yes stop_codon:yes gene_type:complete
MDSSRRRNNKNNFDIGNLDRKVDQFLEVGRQFVDGVSGTRPGSRRRNRFNRFSSANVKDVGRWVSDKVESIFEDDEFEGWDDDNGNTNEFKSFSRGVDSESKQENFFNKRPLEAKSLREIDESVSNELPKLLDASEEWPEESDFKVSKWQRSNKNEDITFEKNPELNRSPKTKSFPKSRRRRI